MRKISPGPLLSIPYDRNNKRRRLLVSLILLWVSFNSLSIISIDRGVIINGPVQRLYRSGPEVITFFMLKSAEHEFFFAYKS